MTASAAGRVRTWLDENLFPDAPRPPRLSSRRVLVVAGILVVLAAIQLPNAVLGAA